jgi:hypothetical protein
MTDSPPKLHGVSDLREFFRTNQTPVYFISPTAFNLLGIDRWVRNFNYISWYDSFEGGHPGVFVPASRQAPEFESIKLEDRCRSWIAGIRAEVAGTPLVPEQPAPVTPTSFKMA